jgi:hypothetical protein
VAVLVIVVVSGLYLGGVPPFGARSTTTTGARGPLTFAAARAAGDALVQGYHGGGWQLLAAGALVTPVGLTLPVPASGGTFLNCTVQPVAGLTQVVAPGFQGSPSSGASTLWGLVYWANGAGLIVSVVNGTAQVAATVTGESSCLTVASAIAPIPSSIVDSSTAVTAAAAAGGTQFLADHPGANLSFAVEGGFSILFFNGPPTWRVAYSTCPLVGSTSGKEPEFNATINAAGAVTGSGLGTTNCSGFASLGSLPLPGGFSLAHRVGLPEAAAPASVGPCLRSQA